MGTWINSKFGHSTNLCTPMTRMGRKSHGKENEKRGKEVKEMEVDELGFIQIKGKTTGGGQWSPKDDEGRIQGDDEEGKEGKIKSGRFDVLGDMEEDNDQIMEEKQNEVEEAMEAKRGQNLEGTKAETGQNLVLRRKGVPSLRNRPLPRPTTAEIRGDSWEVGEVSKVAKKESNTRGGKVMHHGMRNG